MSGHGPRKTCPIIQEIAEHAPSPERGAAEPGLREQSLRSGRPPVKRDNLTAFIAALHCDDITAPMVAVEPKLLDSTEYIPDHIHIRRVSNDEIVLRVNMIPEVQHIIRQVRVAILHDGWRIRHGCVWP